MVGIGLISYPLYLWHWLLLSFAWIARGKTPPAGVRWVLVIASFLLAYLTYRFVEKRIRAAGKRMAMALAGTMLALGALGLLAYSGAILPRNDSPAIGPIVEALHDWQYPDGFVKTNFVGAAVKSIKAGEKTVLFIGDSHLEQYGPRVVQLLRSNPEKYSSALFLTDPGCAPVPGSAQTNPYHLERCRVFRGQVAELVRRPDIDAVFIAAAWNLYFLKSSSQAPENLDLDFELRNLQSFIESIVPHKRVYVLLDNPSGWQFEPRHFFAGSRLTGVAVKPFQKQVTLDKDQNALRLRLTEALLATGAKVIDPVEYLCVNRQCPVVTVDGKPIYKDDNHYRPFYVKENATFIDVALQK